ncbi:MAG TPA: ROK family protein [Galbitalea sp.]|jgi:glucokinase|nr:ROK family protein [Galbitalea sp.]
MSARKLVLAVDLGGTKIASALVSDDPKLLDGSRFRVPTGHDISRADLEAAIRSVVSSALAAVPAGDEVIGVGIGSAGPVAVAAGEISPLNMPNCWDFPIARIVSDVVPRVPVSLQLDGHCIALAEHWVGALRGYRNAVGMVVSTGVGGGFIIDGRLLEGRTGNAGHIGQVRVTSPAAAGPDLDSTLEGVASGTGTVRWAKEQGWKGETGEDLGASYAAGDAIAIAAVRRCGEALGYALSTVGALLDVEAVAIGGGFSHVTPDLFDIVRASLKERAPLRTMAGIEVLPSGLSDEGPLIGAAALIYRSHLLPSHD